MEANLAALRGGAVFLLMFFIRNVMPYICQL